MEQALVSRDSNNIVAASNNRPAFVSESLQWDRHLTVIKWLWSDLPLPKLMTVMEEDYGFRATEDQYKKKFNDWYDQGKLHRKNRRRGERSQRVKPQHLENGNILRDIVVESHHNLPTPSPTPENDENMALVGPVNKSSSPSNPGTPVPMQGQLVPQYVASEEHRRHEFRRLLGDLWDTYFEAEFGQASHVEVGEAVRNMIEFILDVAATDPSLSTVETLSGDLALLRRVAALIRHHYPNDEDLWGKLVAAVSPVPVRTLHLGRFGDEWRFFYDRHETPTWNSLLRRSGGVNAGMGHTTELCL
ncbi:hypothetical protein BDV96DRAFT_644294 [Lophiotrema nucula]|uniref:Clr5 domain-containing protein n=1 Tax=Lophiotrema nucula TaxID=690887 RepID=A0A6A5ZEN2_9PLEO|nr:hypothetical protein BDV96DRAFT_644294 [Lophiotrema nucula]